VFVVEVSVITTLALAHAVTGIVKLATGLIVV